MSKNIEFVLGSADRTSPVRAGVEIAADGDVELMIEGVIIAYVSAVDGKLHTRALCEVDRRQLRACGLSINASRIEGVNN